MEFIRVLLGITIALFSCHVQAQGKFYNTYTDNGYDMGEGIVQLADSSYLITGASSSFYDEPARAFILHVDKFGNRLWSKPYGGSESQRGRRIFHIENDGIYVAGYTSSIGSGSFDFYFFKTDLTGNLIYEKAYGGPNFERLHDAALVPADTSFILVGETKSNPEEIENLYIMRLKSNGDTLWTKQIGSPGADIARGVEMISDTTFVIVGDYYEVDSLKQKALLMKMHINGSVDWLQTVGQKGECSLNDVTLDAGDLRAVGYLRYRQGNVDYSKLYGIISTPAGIVTHESIDQSAAIYTRYGYITNYSVLPNKYYVSEQSTIGVAQNFGGGGEDAIISRIEGGTLYWTGGGVSVSSFGDDQITQLIRTSDGGAVAVGYNSSGGIGGNNVTLMKIGENDDFIPSYDLPNQGSLVLVNEIDETIQISIFPNPVEDILQIEVGSLENVHVQIMDATGNMMEESSFNKLTSINLSEYANGLYLIRLEISGEFKTFKILKK